MPDSNDIIVNETEVKPNRYAANVLISVVIVIYFAFVMNQAGVFNLNSFLIYICLAVSILMLVIMQIIVRSPARLLNPASKYVMMGMVLLLVLTTTVLLNIHAVLAYVLPLLLATQYRSYKVSVIALAGSVVCCLISPILSYRFGTWSLDFMVGYIETFCRVTVSIDDFSSLTAAEALKQITLYWSLPQVCVLGAFAPILFSTTKAGIENVKNQTKIITLSNDLNKQLKSITVMQEKFLYSMSDIIESRDIETGGHVRRTSEIIRLLMDAIRADESNVITDSFYANVINSAPMHDIGKISTPDAILRKPARLTPEEYAVVKLHPDKSAEIIRDALTGIENDELIVTATNLAKYHHEKFDGTGYPDGLAGKEIPLEARIMAIADVYDALVSKRCYKAPMSFDEAFDIIEKSMGSQFDPDLNKYFVLCRHDIEAFISGETGTTKSA